MTQQIPMGSERVKANGGMNMDEVRKLSFWVSQICVIIATILGVYLAASQGLQQALSFDRIQGDKASYYLRKSLHDEVSGNVEVLKQYIANLKSTGNRAEPLEFNTYIWESMKYSSYTLETPSQWLNGVQRFYATSRGIYNKLNAPASATIGVSYGITGLNKAIDDVEKILPELEKSASEIKSQLSSDGISL